ncbi:MAG: hypothetical protein ACJAT5_000983 [Lentimonas sp.]|jgi:hypothetical protein
MSATDMQNSTQVDPSTVKKENVFLNMGFNILIPIFVLNKGQKLLGKHLEPYSDNVAVTILLIALLFPIVYFVYDYYKRAKYNLFSIIGLISVLLTGGIGILEIPTQWFAVKEAAIPFLLGIAVIVSLKTPWPLIRTLLYNPEIINVDKVHHALEEHGKESAFEKLLEKCTWLLALSFLFSSILNYVLARWMVVSPSGTDAFNSEVSKMMFWSWPVIVIPSLLITTAILWTLLSGIRTMTGLSLESTLAIENTSKTDDASNEETPGS